MPSSRRFQRIIQYSKNLLLGQQAKLWLEQKLWIKQRLFYPEKDCFPYRSAKETINTSSAILKGRCRPFA